MGLDMWAFSVPAQQAGSKKTDLEVDRAYATEIFYWRKHHDLHGWMHQLYKRKGGKSDSFNCNTLKLDLDDLYELERDLRNQNLPETKGFFFGNYPPDDESLQRDLEFIAKAKQCIADGQVVFYDSWW